MGQDVFRNRRLARAPSARSAWRRRRPTKRTSSYAAHPAQLNAYTLRATQVLLFSFPLRIRTRPQLAAARGPTLKKKTHNRTLTPSSPDRSNPRGARAAPGLREAATVSPDYPTEPEHPYLVFCAAGSPAFLSRRPKERSRSKGRDRETSMASSSWHGAAGGDAESAPSTPERRSGDQAGGDTGFIKHKVRGGGLAL